MMAPLRVFDAARYWLDDQGRASTGLVINYTKHKPHSTLVGFSGPNGMRGHVRRFSQPTEAAHALAKARTRRLTTSMLGVDVVGIDANTVLFGFPNDPLLPRLRWLIEPRKLKRTFATIAAPDHVRSSSTSDVLAYKPQRRVVAKIALTTARDAPRNIVVRYTATPTAHHTLATASALTEAGILTPRPVTALFDNHAAVTEYLPGSQLASAVRADPGGTAEAAIELSERVANTSLPVAPPASETAILDRRHNELRLLSGAYPHRTNQAINALQHASVPTTDHIPSHRDFTGANIISTEKGLALIDLERAGQAPAPFDLASLVADIEARALLEPQTSAFPTFIDPITEHAVRRWGHAAFAWHRSTSLIGIATRWHRHTTQSPPVAPVLDLATSYLKATRT